MSCAPYYGQGQQALIQFSSGPSIDPDDDRVTRALDAFYDGDRGRWKAPFRTRQGENQERFRMAMALDAADRKSAE